MKRSSFNCCKTKLILIIFRWLLKSCLLSNQYSVDYHLSVIFVWVFFFVSYNSGIWTTRRSLFFALVLIGLKILRHSFLTSRLLCPPLNENYLSKNLENASNLGTTISDCWLIGFIRKLWRAFIYPMLLWNWGNIRIQFYVHIGVAQFWNTVELSGVRVVEGKIV